jgi:hypothetical protein
MVKSNWFENHKVLGTVLIVIGVIIAMGLISSFIMPKDKSSSNDDIVQSSVKTEASTSTDYLECSSNRDCSSSEECKSNKCVSVTPAVSEDVLGHSRSKPASINTPLTIHFGYSWGQLTDAEITLLNVKRGATAWSAIQEANQFNSEPEEGMEYLLAKFRFKVIKTSDDKSYSLGSYDFSAISENGVVYDSPFVVLPSPELSGDLYAGATKEGWVAFEIDKADATPLLSFNRDSNGQDELWFSLK